METETEATDESLCLVVSRRGYYGKVEGWRPAEIVERRQVRADHPIDIGEARAELEWLAELRNQAAWGLKGGHAQTPLAATGEPAAEDPRVAPLHGGVRRKGR